MLRMLRSRISRRVITEQHLALTEQFRERQRTGNKGKGRAVAQSDVETTRVGIVDTRLNAADVVRKCAELIRALGGPESQVPILIEGATERTFAYISEHLESVPPSPRLRDRIRALTPKHLPGSCSLS